MMRILRAVGVVVVVVWLDVVAGPLAATLVTAVAVAADAMWTWRGGRSPGGRRLLGWPNEPVSSDAVQPHEAPSRSCAEPEPVGLAAMTTDEICRRWQRSYWALRDVASIRRRGAIVVLRGDLLDELERRDPAGFAQWLRTEPRPVSDPGRYLAAGS